jgi:nucleoside 2-deoxyribosyltransferase
VSDWPDKLSPEERDSWDEFVAQFRADALQKIDSSAFVLSLVPREDFDVKFALELGTAIMLGKPIIAVLAPGARIPGNLEHVVTRFIRADVDTEQGRKVITEALLELGE